MPKLAELNFLFRGDASSEHGFIVMHGYGADMNDLAPIGEWMSEQIGGAWYFLQAPLEVAIGPYMSGRAWFPIDMMKLQMASMQGDFAAIFENDLPAGVEEASKKIEAALDVVKNRHQNIHLAGFSQGAMMAAKVAMANQTIFKSLNLLSGVLVARSLWEKDVQTVLPFATFQSHGSTDPVLPIGEAHKLKKFLHDHNPDHTYIEFPGGHEIPMPVLQSWKTFLQKVMA